MCYHEQKYSSAIATIELIYGDTDKINRFWESNLVMRTKVYKRNQQIIWVFV